MVERNLQELLCRLARQNLELDPHRHQVVADRVCVCVCVEVGKVTTVGTTKQHVYVLLSKL